MWRPKDKEAWEKDRYEVCSRIEDGRTYKVYEAGADAMLEGLKRKGLENQKGVRCYLVSIPEEQE